jgi:hypothetical protein
MIDAHLLSGMVFRSSAYNYQIPVLPYGDIRLCNAAAAQEFVQASIAFNHGLYSIRTYWEEVCDLSCN